MPPWSSYLPLSPHKGSSVQAQSRCVPRAPARPKACAGPRARPGPEGWPPLSRGVCQAQARRTCSPLSIKPDSLPLAHVPRAPAGFPGDCWSSHCAGCSRHGPGGLQAKDRQTENQPKSCPEGWVLRTKRTLSKQALESTVAEGFIARRCVGTLPALLHLVLLLSRFSDR